MNNIYDSKLINLIPPNLRDDPDIISASKAIDKEFNILVNSNNNVLTFADIDNVKSEVLDSLAWELHVDFYDSDLPIETRRQIVKSSLIWHFTKGTPFAVEGLINALAGEGKVLEWFEYGGQPYRFKVVFNDPEVAQENINLLKKALNTVKNTRSWLEGIVISFHIKLNNKPKNKTLYNIFINTESLFLITNNFRTFDIRISTQKPLNDYVSSTQPIFNGQFYFNGQLNFDAPDGGVTKAPANQFGTLKVKRNEVLVEEIRI